MEIFWIELDTYSLSRYWTYQHLIWIEAETVIYEKLIKTEQSIVSISLWNPFQNDELI